MGTLLNSQVEYEMFSKHGLSDDTSSSWLDKHVLHDSLEVFVRDLVHDLSRWVLHDFHTRFQKHQLKYSEKYLSNDAMVTVADFAEKFAFQVGF